jgi:hypothetical protein
VHVRPAFGFMDVRQLHRGLIKSPLVEKLNSGLAADTVRLIHATIRAMLNAAVDDGVILANPANRLGKALRLVRPKSARQEELKAFDRVQNSPVSGSGRRWPPMADVDFEGREIRVERAITNSGVLGTPKSGHGRTVDMSSSLRDVLRHHEATLAAAWLKKRPDRAPDSTEVPKGRDAGLGVSLGRMDSDGPLERGGRRSSGS